jgi:type II secretory pathway pseudopilin PulG
MQQIIHYRRLTRTICRWLAGAHSGMTILELLVAVLIGLFTVAAAMDAYLSLHTQSVLQNEVNEMQQSGRAAMHVLSGQLRMAGFGLPATLVPLAGSDTNPDTITVTNMDPGGCEVSLSAAMASASDNLVCSGADLSCFSPGMRVYVYDAVNGVGEFFYVTSVASGPPSLSHDAALARAYPQGARVSRILQTTYYLDRSDSLHPVLMQRFFGSNPEPYAENIEDLQFSYVMQDGDTTNTPVNPTLVRNVLVRLVARSNRVDKVMERDYHRREFLFTVSVRNQE